MKHFSFDEIKEMDIKKDYTPLALHWESTDKVQKTLACNIMFDIKAGKFSQDRFDRLAYCITWKEFEQEQKEFRENA